jgi:hypothetical protein
MSGANPLGFMASLGLLRVLSTQGREARLGFMDDGTYHPFVEAHESDLSEIVANDAALAGGEQGWVLAYKKQEKNGDKVVADLKAPPVEFSRFLARCVEQWLLGDGEPAAYAAAYGTSTAVDGKGNTKPMALHFTAAQQQFLGTVESIRGSVTSEWCALSLFAGHAGRKGSNLRWDPAAERSWALMANNPTTDGTTVDAPIEWLAFRGLPLLPSFPFGSRILTTAVAGRGEEMRMTWPLWSVPLSLATAKSVLHMAWTDSSRDRAPRGVFAVCSSPIRRTSQGFGNFAPATIRS